MNTKQTEKAEPVEDRNALLEKALIEDYLRGKGYSHEGLKKLPADLVEKLMKEPHSVLRSNWNKLKHAHTSSRNCKMLLHRLKNDE